MAQLLGRMAGVDGIPVVRAMTRRVLLLAQLRGQVDQGDSVERALETQGKAIFWKEKGEVGGQVARWGARELATALERLGEAERRLKASGALGGVAIEQELLEIARHAARRR